MDRRPRRNDSNHIVEVVADDEEERRPCNPLDPPERAEPTPPPSLKQPRKTRCPQGQREFYQNQFPAEP